MLGNGAMAEQAIGQFPPQFNFPVAVRPQHALSRRAVPFLQLIRSAAPSLTSSRQSVPFLQRSRQTPPSTET